MAEEAKWYVAHTYSGYENKVKTTIEKTVENQFGPSSKKPVQQSTRGVNYPHQLNMGYTSWN